MKIEIVYNKEWLDITKYIDTSISIGNQSRIDDVFAVGQFTAILEINENIPPYTPMKINGVDYLCSSVATKHFSSVNNRKTYYHNFTILEATAILSCYILGSKAFSVTGTNITDIDKIHLTLDLMNYKYNLRLRLNPNIRWTLFKEQELSYGSGTTLYDFLNDILKAYNYRIKVDSFWIEPDQSIGSSPIINLSILDLNDDIEYSLDLNKITYVEKSQNTELFSDIIEGEMINVVDRDITSYANGLVTSSDDIKLTEDNAFIELPTNAENIKEFGVEGYIGESGMNFHLSHNLCDALGIYQAIGGKDFTFEEKENVIFNGIKIMPYIYERLFSDIISWEYFKKIEWHYNDGLSGNSYDVYWADNDARFYMKVDITNKLLEKSQWDLLEVKEKPKYVWYQTNTNKIQGVNTYYKDDIWHNLFGGTVYPFLYHLDYVRQTKVVDNIYFNDEFVAGFNNGKETTTSERTISKSFTGDYNPLNYTFYIKYNPITNPMVLENTKNKSYFNISRSYGKQASYIDYDKLINSLNIVKESEGLKELKLELDLELDDVLPTAGQCIYYENEKWYISNIVYSLKINHNEMTLNCVKNYNKTADVIGVETQFNSTKNPLNGIVDRSIYVDFGSGSEINYNDLNNLYVKLTFRDYNGNIISNAFKKCNVLTNNNVVHLYCEADDQYSIGNQSILQPSLGKVYLNKHYPYVDFNNELYNMDVEIVKLPLLNVDDSHLLPEYNGDYEMLLKTELIPIFKDAREKLLFTFKVNNIIM